MIFVSPQSHDVFTTGDLVTLATDLLSVDQGTNLCFAVCQRECRSRLGVVLGRILVRILRGNDGEHTQSAGPTVPTSTIKCCLEMVLFAITNCPARDRQVMVNEMGNDHTLRLRSPKDKLLPRTKPQLLAFNQTSACSLRSNPERSYPAARLLQSRESTYLPHVLDVGDPESLELRYGVVWGCKVGKNVLVVIA